MGLFITLEGIEGSGKSTQARILEEKLSGKGYKTVLTREPGEGEIGEKIRDILLNIESHELLSLTELHLLLADRAQHVNSFIRPALDANTIVICDRYIDSSMAYQGYGRGISTDFIRQMNMHATDGLIPDTTFLFDLNVETGLLRSQNRLKQQDMFSQEGRFESESLNFHKRVRQGYLKLAHEESDRFFILNAEKNMKELTLQMWNHIVGLVTPEMKIMNEMIK